MSEYPTAWTSKQTRRALGSHLLRARAVKAEEALAAAVAERDDFKRSYMEQRGMREESDMRLVETMAERDEARRVADDRAIRIIRADARVKELEAEVARLRP